MIGMNIRTLRKRKNLTQESLAEAVGVSPMTEDELEALEPKGKHFFGVSTVGERGQIVIPKRARDLYQILPGEQMIFLGEDETKGLAVLKSSSFLEFASLIQKALLESSANPEETP